MLREVYLKKSKMINFSPGATGGQKAKAKTKQKLTFASYANLY